MGNGLTATTQVLAEGSNDFQMEVEWAYVSYSITPSLIVQTGRLRTPFYLYSSALDVGYTYHWISPPAPVYASAGLTRFEGVDLVQHNWTC